MPVSAGYHVCEKGERSALYDARGIFCCYVCSRCEDERRARYRPEIFEEPDYETTEAIDEE